MLQPSTIQSRPDLPQLFCRAHRAHQAGALDEAERLYRIILEYEPDHFDVLHLLGFLCYQRGRLADAVEYLTAALRHNDQSREAWSNLGLALHAAARPSDALACYTTALRLEPDNPNLLNRRAIALLDLEKPQDAMASLDRALVIKPDLVEALGNRGNAFVKLNRPNDAIVDYDSMRKISGDSAQLLTNRAHALRRLDRLEDAVVDLEQAIVLDPQFAEAHFELALARLSMGDFDIGWQEYEWRWKTAAFSTRRRAFAVPQWSGEQALAGKTILLHAEQGFGDTIQFARYAARVAELGASVVLEVEPELLSLVAGMQGAGRVVARGEKLPRCDLHCPLMSLPYAFKTDVASIPAAIPYINISAADVPDLSPRKPRVGVVWAGRRSHSNDLNRSIALRDFAPIFDLNGVQFMSLQRDIGEEDAKLLRDKDVLDVSEHLKDFAATAAVIARLDLIVTVDTAVAHLAGALGKSVYLLLPFAADFRWLRQRQDSPWYPTAKLFRQPKFRDWDSVIALVQAQLS